MQDIISPIDRDLLLKELNKERFVRDTNNGNNEIISYKPQFAQCNERGRTIKGTNI